MENKKDFRTNNDIVRDMLAKKFEKKNDISRTENERKSYQEAKEKADVSTMLYHKLGIAEGKDRENRRAELSKNNIKDVLREIENTKLKMAQLENDYLEKGKKLDIQKEELKAEYEQKIQGKPFSKQAILQDEYYTKLKALENAQSLKELQEEYTANEKLLADLQTTKQNYLEENQDIINKLLLDKRVKDIEESHLLDD